MGRPNGYDKPSHADVGTWEDIEEHEDQELQDVAEVQFTFFEGHADESLRRTPSSMGERLRSGIQNLASQEHHSQAFNLARIIVFLSLLGVLPAAIIFLIDLTVHAVTSARETISVKETQGILGFAIYIISGVLLCLLSTLICLVLSQEAEGSGIPQMKAIMSGFYDKLKPALSMWALVAKSLGLICAIGGGLPVGWEGPNVHISCIVAHHLSRLPMFRALRKDRALRLQIMVAACSVGLASSFGTPIGGVLYALETTASFYLVPTFWKSVLATITGALFFDILYKTPLVEALENTEFEEDDYKRSQLIAFAILGCIMGVMGAFFVKCVKFIYEIRKHNSLGKNRFLLVGAVGFIAAALSYEKRLFRLDPRSAINELFSSNSMQSLSWVDVLLLLVIKFPLVAVSIGLPVPAGVFIPCFLLGSAMGRLYGEVLKAIIGSAIVPGGFAVVGAAAFTAGVTRALSCAVVLFEVTGQLQHMVPSLVAVLLAVIVGHAFNRGLYDTLIIMKALPYMPHLRKNLDPAMPVRQVMNRNLVTLPEFCTVDYAEDVLRDRGKMFEAFPVCTPGGGFVGALRRSSLVYLIERAKVNRRADEQNPELQDGHAVPMPEVDEIESVDVTSTLRIEPAQPKQEQTGSTYTFKVEVDLSPLTVTDKTSLGQLHFMFVMLMPSHAYVLSKGRLVGVVRRKDIIFSGKEDTERVGN